MRTDQACDVKIALANSEPSTHGTFRASSFSGFDPLPEVWRFVADGFVLQRPIASVERAPYHKARLIQINAALIRANFHAGGCEEFMKVHAIQAGSDRGPGAWPAATPATILLGRFEKAHPIDPAQRAQHVKAGFPSRMERR